MTHTSVSVQALHARMQAGEQVELIDVRTPAEYQGVHVAAARLLPLNSFDPGTAFAQRQVCDGPLHLICHSGARAREAADRCLAAGFNEVVIVEGGTQAWERAGLPLVRGRSRGISIERQTQLVIGLIVASGAALAIAVHPYFALISGLVGLGLMNAGISGLCPLASLIAAMPWNRGGSCRSCLSSCSPAAPATAEKQE